MSLFRSIHLATLLTQIGISHRIDTTSGSIGKRYARCDEIAIPFAITIDFDTLQQPHSVAFRELDSLKQIRVNVISIKRKHVSDVFLLYLD